MLAYKYLIRNLEIPAELASMLEDVSEDQWEIKKQRVIKGRSVSRVDKQEKKKEDLRNKISKNTKFLNFHGLVRNFC